MEDQDKPVGLGIMNSLPSSRKGQQSGTIASLGVIAITLLLAVVVLGLGGTILEKIQVTHSDDSSTTTVNQTFIITANNSEVNFDQARVSPSSVIVYGNTTKMTLGVNYTVSGAGVKVYADRDGDTIHNINGIIYNMTYDYQIGSIAYNSSNFGQTGVLTLAEFIPTIAIVAAAAIVIGILLVFFGRRKGA